MIKQKSVTIKTINATLTYSEIGDIVCNSATDITITLPIPNSGLWHRISNVGAGIVTVYYGSALATLKQTDQCLCLANASTGWFFSKGGGAMTKAEIENVLTGELSSHSHAVVYELPTGGTLGQVLAKNSSTDRDIGWGDISGGGLVIDPNHIFVDNLARNDYFTTNPAELITGIYISVDTGFQLWDGASWVDKTAVVTGPKGDTGLPGADGLPGVDGLGVPAGGTVGQILSKIDNIDNNTEWVTPSGGTPGITYYALFNNGLSTSSRAERGYCVRFLASASIDIIGGSFYTDWILGTTFTCKLWSVANVVIATGSLVGDGTTGRKTVEFAGPFKLDPLTDYIVSIEIPTGTIQKYYGADVLPNAFVNLVEAWSGVPLETLSSASSGYDIGVVLSF